MYRIQNIIANLPYTPVSPTNIPNTIDTNAAARAACVPGRRSTLPRIICRSGVASSGTGP
ncbi:hypothetical protein EMIT0P258_230008 [Pseudomonas sp. IT-P258]